MTKWNMVVISNGRERSFFGSLCSKERTKHTKIGSVIDIFISSFVIFLSFAVKNLSRDSLCAA